ncbi:MAG: fimbrillin family protein [Bacteroidales bacterium]|nr:fimbrillin family protein [Bacteroidales bacterium]
MKKLVIIATAIAALVACTKTDIEFSNDKEISFAPNALSTKALILPDSDSPEQLAFPETESFNVFAFADLDGNGADYQTDYAHPLMNDVNISKQGGDWKATTGTYLWPATGTVDFYAYYPGSLTAEFISDADPKSVSLTGISLGTTIGTQIDPLVANTVAQIAANKPTVNLVFKHITSQIAVTAFDATTTTSLQGKISIKNVVFKNMKTSGNYREGTSTGKGTWSNINTNTDFTSFSGSEVLATTESFLSAGSFAAAIDNSAAFVVVPEGIVTGTAADQAIEVTYAIAAYSINGFDYPATPNQTVTIPLYNRVSGNTFQNGKRYVFHIGISLDGANNEIMFSPVVEGWETEDITGITIDAVNAGLL